jgi:hypothetical protein
MQGHDLDDFVAYSDAEIATIRAFLHEQGEEAGLVQPNGDDDDEESATSDADNGGRSLLSQCDGSATDSHSGELLDMCNGVPIPAIFLLAHFSYLTRPPDAELFARHKLTRRLSAHTAGSRRFLAAAGGCHATKGYQRVQTDRIEFDLESGASRIRDVGRPGNRAEARTRAKSRRSSAPTVSNEHQTVTEARVRSLIHRMIVLSKSEMTTAQVEFKLKRQLISVPVGPLFIHWLFLRALDL